MLEAAPAAIGILLVLGFSLREWRSSSIDILPILELADRGNLNDAIVAVATLAKGERDWQRKAFYVGILSNLELRAGNMGQALVLARESVRHSLREQPSIARLLHANFAMLLALDGNTQEAQSVLPQGPPNALSDCAQMVLWMCQDNLSELAAYNHAKLPMMQGIRHTRRVMSLCKAFALYTTNTGALQLQKKLEDARPRIAGEYEYLMQGYFPLRNFVEQHPLLNQPRSLLERSI